ncbi:UDP-2,4-diacetamido-2,4,6-trideoxy-beta-L-altropyranose hydrolase [Alphaproteobacteria bacterium]|nr:UDP-2,4-diacetamido-2,4,6-trideoxy-beta-L-altropyranose hydrolase [Alphaproteobacteria bacterium]
MKVIFRVDASLQIGTGHVMRCLTLAEALKENNVSSAFICRKHRGNLIEKIRSYGFQVRELQVLKKTRSDNRLFHSHWLGTTQQQDANDCINILKEEKVDWLIIDHYALDQQWQRRLKPFYKKLMVIDDLADRKHYCDILLDQTFARQQEDYFELVEKDCLLLLGSKYALIRPEFLKWRMCSLNRRSKPKFNQLLINMGGVDVNNVTTIILDELVKCNLPKNINITVIMGKDAPHLESVKLKAKSLLYNTIIKVDVGNMAEIMANTDIAIGAAGSTSWERCCLGLPTIQIIIAKNQIVIANSLAKYGAIKILENIKELSTIINNRKSWMIKVSDIAQDICDGLGVKRVCDKVMINQL